MFIEVVIRDCRPGVMEMLFKSLFIQLRRRAFLTVLKQGKFSPPLDKGLSRSCCLMLFLFLFLFLILFFHRKANSLLWVC